jgi:Putative DNA-binding domain
MHSLDQEIRIFGSAILSDRPDRAARSLELRARRGADPYARLNVYRNNTYTSLTAVLLAVFPVTARLLHERYFRYACHAFISSSPPTEPRLSNFGAEFPEFLSRFENLRAMPFVADTARLEWAIAAALDAEQAPRVPISSLLDIEDPTAMTLGFQPSLRLFISRWQVASIWSAHQNTAEPELDFAMGLDVERIALWRNGTSIRMLLLDKAGFAFLRSAIRGLSLETAASRAVRFDPLFDLAAALARLFSEGLVTMAPKKVH